MLTDAKIPERNASYFERFIKHVTELSHCLKLNENAILLTCFLYDAPKFLVPKPTPKNKIIRDIVWEAVKSGVRMWQINLNIDLYGVSLLDYFEITHLFENQPM
jgi:sugar fermentation stimulation protein A